MIKYLALISVVIAAAAAFQLPAPVVAGSSMSDSDIRAFAIAEWPSPADASVVLAVGVEGAKSTEHVAGDAYLYVASNYNGPPVAAFAYFAASADVPSGSGALTSLTAAAFGWGAAGYYVFEYQDNNGVEGFQPISTDKLLGWYNLSCTALQWKPIDLSWDNSTGAPVYFATLGTTDGVFTARVSGSGHPVQVNGVTLHSKSMKIDVGINYFNNSMYTGSSACASGPSSASSYPDAKVGLLYGVIMGAKGVVVTQDGTGGNPGQINVAEGKNSGVFSYQPNADVIVQGVQSTEAVVAGFAQADPALAALAGAGLQLKLAYFSFLADRPEYVYWDPQMTVDIEATSAATAPVVAFMALMVALVALLF
jgi:hypothetical protein